MNCIEVGELMQRNLDSDLNEHELTILMNHLSECATCSQLFEKLTLLSGSLEQLPRVTPSISIVDAILPELERIDQQKKIEEQSTSRKRNSRMRWYTSLGSIAAAAVVIITMVSINGLPGMNNNNNASVALNEFFQRSSDDSMSKADSPSNFPSSAQLNGENDALSSPTTLFGEYLNNVNEGVISQFGLRRQADAPAEGISKYNIIDQSGGTFAKEAKESADARSMVNDDQLPLAEPAEPPFFEGNVEESDKLVPDEYNIVGGIQLTQLSNVSPDEQVYLQFEEHTISVYDYSTGELVQQWNKLIDGEYQFGEWADDHSYFTYTIVDNNGKLHSYSERLIVNE